MPEDGDTLKLRFIGALVEQLGAQLYPSATATVAELISNAWDADAKNTWITIPFGDAWRPESEIVVIDDGHGMTRHDAADLYLIVGRKRRLKTGDTSPGGRKVHGRKGIGKLAAFGTARILECATLKDGALTMFRLDYDAIRKLRPAEDYSVEESEDIAPLTSPETEQHLEHGTRIRLTNLNLRRELSGPQFLRSMARRFAISSTEMRVVINGKELERFSIPLEFRFPADGIPPGDIRVDDDGWAYETIDDGKQVRWWFGFTEKPLDEDAHQGISVVANGKMVQRPFKFEKTQGTTGQLGQEYLVGEVEANWLDKGTDIEDDLIQSNRDQLQLEDVRLDSFLEWGRKRLTWALRARNQLRSQKVLEKFRASETLEKLLESFTTNERKSFMRVATTVAQIPEISSAQVDTLMNEIVNAREDVVIRQLMERIEEETDVVQERMWSLVQEFGLIDARRTLSIIRARVETIRRLKDAIEGGATEIPEIHTIVQNDSWLLDPRWHLLDDEVDISKLGIEHDPEIDSESGLQMDFLFVLQPRPPAPIDEVVVVEIKRGSHPDGRIHKANDQDIAKFQNYVGAAQAHYENNTNPPRVRGLMIAEDYTERASRLRRQLEQISEPKMEFKTWGRVIEETERMHLGWLEVSQRRSRRPE